jgi:hypothetical protein
VSALEGFLQSCYFEVEEVVVYRRFPAANQLKRIVQHPARSRALFVLRPFTGANRAHTRPAPLGLARYGATTGSVSPAPRA